MGIIYRQGHNGRLSVQEMDDNFHFIENSLSGLSSLEVGLSASLSTLATLEHLDVAGLTASILGLSMSISNISLTPGPTGATGLQGPIGITGSQGPIGATGSQGPIGITGSQGPTGATGVGFAWRGEWNPDYGTYSTGVDVVSDSGSNYIKISGSGNSGSSPSGDPTRWALYTSAGATGSQGPTGPAGATGPSGLTFSYGMVEALTSFPYPLLSYKVNNVWSAGSTPPYRVSLPTFTALLGDKVTVLNSGDYMISVTAAQMGASKIYLNGITGTQVFEFYIYPNQQYDFTYIEEGKWLCQVVQSRVLLEYVAPLYQSGTASPLPQTPVIDTLRVGYLWMEDYFRDIDFTRTGVGKYKLWIKWKNVDTNSSNLGIMFGDGICVTDGYRQNGTDGNGVHYTSFDFSTYTPGGTASDSLLLGTNAACFSVKLYQ